MRSKIRKFFDTCQVKNFNFSTFPGNLFGRKVQVPNFYFSSSSSVEKWMVETGFLTVMTKSLFRKLPCSSIHLSASVSPTLSLFLSVPPTILFFFFCFVLFLSVYLSVCLSLSKCLSLSVSVSLSLSLSLKTPCPDIFPFSFYNLFMCNLPRDRIRSCFIQN